MRLTVIGCAGSFPSPQSPASCYLVEHEGVAITLDLGNGALGPLYARTDIRALDAVVLSHLHADHCLDLTSLHVARKYHPDGPPPVPVAVHGPAGTEQRIADAYRTTRAERPPALREVYRFVDHAPQPARIGPFTVTLARVAHPVEAFAIRVEAGGAALVYSGDTGPCDALVELARGADLALFEASFLAGPDNPRDLHMTAAEAGEHAARAGVPRLLLTHLVAWNDQQASVAEARGTYDGELVLAAPGMVVEL
ncbi:MAG: MBL fold metallo-hydrolase [Candidatus Nanopelagicales bacterium]|nr:MBL fold metallo-hydrolase [Candidatus Nanopelagicales bacterium]